MFEEQGSLDVPDLVDKAGRIGLDVDAFRECLATDRHSERVQEDVSAAMRMQLSGTPSLPEKCSLVAAVVAILVAVTAIACSEPGPLGDGTLRGDLPSGWEEAEPRPEDALLRVTSPSEPLPYEIVVLELDESGRTQNEGLTDAWEVVDETTVVGATKLIGDEWQPLHRDVRIYRRQLRGMALEARVDTRFARAEAERFLRSLAPASR